MMKKIGLVVLLFFILIFKVKASSSILMDIDSHRILYSNNIYDKRSVASISKIMTT